MIDGNVASSYDRLERVRRDNFLYINPSPESRPAPLRSQELHESNVDEEVVVFIDNPLFDQEMLLPVSLHNKPTRVVQTDHDSSAELAEGSESTIPLRGADTAPSGLASEPTPCLTETAQSKDRDLFESLEAGGVTPMLSSTARDDGTQEHTNPNVGLTSGPSVRDTSVIWDFASGTSHQGRSDQAGPSDHADNGRLSIALSKLKDRSLPLPEDDASIIWASGTQDNRHSLVRRMVKDGKSLTSKQIEMFNKLKAEEQKHSAKVTSARYKLKNQEPLTKDEQKAFDTKTRTMRKYKAKVTSARNKIENQEPLTKDEQKAFDAETRAMRKYKAKVTSARNKLKNQEPLTKDEQRAFDTKTRAMRKYKAKRSKSQKTRRGKAIN
jgi:hypothetical protein